MKPLLTGAAALAAAALAIGCVGRGDRRSDIPNDRGGGPPASVANSPATIVGCLQAADRPATYRLIAVADTRDRAGAGPSAAATSGHAAPAASSTTGVGGDAIADSPSIGG